MKKDLLRVIIRQNAIYLPLIEGAEKREALTSTTIALVAQLRKVGYSLSEELLHAVNQLYPAKQVEILQVMKEVLGVTLNWAPLVKGWDTPTGETRLDHLITWIANIFNSKKGVKLPCGHVIPDNTFPLERYNGCPFCGTPFETSTTEYFGQGSKLKVLELWREKELNVFFCDLLESRTALDATQVDSLKIMLGELPLPAVAIKMKETLMLVIDILVEQDRAKEAQIYFSTPNDILRYLWYKKTGFLQIIEPKTIIRKASKNNAHISPVLDKSCSAAQAKREELKLKYTRRECKMVALWLNNLEMNSEKACEIMHPKREMWIRMIRALRLAEYARKPGFENLKELMEVFYCQTYTVWQGEVDRSRLKADAAQTFALLKQRPGMFARSLFANMLWFGPEETLAAFREVVHLLPARLVVTLGMYAESYFEQGHKRMVKPLGGNALLIEPHYLVGLYAEDQLKAMVKDVQDLCKEVVAARFANASVEGENKSIYIDPMLFHIPLSIGDRSETVQDTSCALQGTRFPVEGDKVRLFMQWGKGLPAQHLDMDLSCHITLPSATEVCSYFNLQAVGAKHSGDIRSIPDKKGTAEYIELDLNELNRVGAQYVAFTCNAYSNGAISPNLVVGWMDSAYPMKISEETGVAYDPSCVQHQVRVSQSLQKGLVFGVLKVKEREIVWLEVSFGGQTVLSLDMQAIEKYLDKLDAKTTVGELLAVKAQAQGLTLADTPEADEVYTREWALNTAAVTKLLLGD
ncbi:hypothetical protein [uncultured Bacteroides sp.]|uniref:hypothetical protein n=1 Tax=uncultured Bacteroides sp. TaxID=162156 RepID=UPI0025CEB64F|nr:hypothetical protein [uncultured Bacteroides sp.]